MVEFRLGRCTFQLHFLFLAALGIVLFTDAGTTALLGIAAVAIHEGGHLLTMVLCGIPPRGVTVQPFGVLIYQQTDCRKSYLRDGLVSLGGPVCNGAAMGLASLAQLWLGMPAESFLLVNAALGVFNILPIESLDGGRALYCFLCMGHPPERADAVVTVVSFLCLVPMAIIGFLFLLESRYNFSLLLASVYLMLCLVLKNRRLLHRDA